MRPGVPSSLLVMCTCLALLGPGARTSQAQQPLNIENFFPGQLVRGQTNVITLAIQTREAVQGAEVSPSQGVKVSGVKNSRSAEISQGVAWWEVTLDVAADAPLGDRALVLLMPMGRRTGPVTINVPNHVPSISDLQILSAQPGQPAVDLQFAAADTSADLGDAPYVWFSLDCGGGEPVVGVVRGKASAKDARSGVVRAVLPRAPAGAKPVAGRCDLQVRASDSGGFDSNTLKTTVDFKN